jgi:hypothetical protein
MKTEITPINTDSKIDFESVIATTPRTELSKDSWDYLRAKIEAEAEERRAELEANLGYTVNKFILFDKDLNECIGFLEEPHRATKMQCIDLYQRGQYTSADDILLQACLIQRESDPRILAENPKRDKTLDALYLGALKVCEGLIIYYTEAQKKN